MRDAIRRDPGFVKLRRGLLAHLPEMSSNAVKLYVWLHLKAHWKPGPKRGRVEASYEDIIGSLVWKKSMVRRTVEELAEKSYIEVTPAANQHQVTRIKILKYDLEECDSAASTGEHTRPFENSAVLSGVLSAVSTSEQSSEHSNSSISQMERGLQAPKNAVEVKKEKKEGADAVRRPVDAELRSSISPSKSASRFRKNQNLTARLAKAIRVNGNQIRGDLDRDERAVLQAAINATDYDATDEKVLTDGFMFTLMEVYEKHKNDGTSPGNLCSKVIDRCLSQQEACKTIGSDSSDYYWPPDFTDHRNRLRERERLQEASAKASGIPSGNETVTERFAKEEPSGPPEVEVKVEIKEEGKGDSTSPLPLKPIQKPHKQPMQRNWSSSSSAPASRPQPVSNRLTDAPAEWIKFSRFYRDACGTAPKSGVERWEKLTGLLTQYQMEDIKKRLETFLLDRNDRDMSWAVDDFLREGIHICKPSNPFPKAERHPL